MALWLVAGAASGAIYADFATTNGMFTVELDAIRAPRAVANFIGLVDGTQSWRDPVTGAVRGGGNGDDFYGEMPFFSMYGTLALLGGMRSHLGSGGTENWEGPGYTILDEATNGVALVRGVLAVAEFEGPHSGGGELALILTDLTASGFEWTGFGAVTGAGMTVVEAMVGEVTNGSGRAVAQVSIRDEDVTPEETAALAAARAELPTVEEMPLGFSRTSNVTTHVSFWSTNQSRACLSVTSNLLAGSWSVLPGNWNTGTNATWQSFQLTSIPGLTNQAGLLSQSCLFGSQAVYPKMTADLFPDKMRIAVAHTGADAQYWLDFAGGTGMWTFVIGGESYYGYLQALRQEMPTANSLLVDFFIGEGFDQIRYLYWFGFDEAGATTGRFYNEQWELNVTLVGVDWGTFELAEGWGGMKAAMAAGASPMKRSSLPIPARAVPFLPVARTDLRESGLIRDIGGLDLTGD